MSAINHDPAEARLTAYVLGELEEPERRELGQQIETCAATRAAVEEISRTVFAVTNALSTEPVAALSDEQRAAIEEASAATEAVQRLAGGRRWRRVLAAVAGMAVTAAGVAWLVWPGMYASDPAAGWREALHVSGNLDDSERMGAHGDESLAMNNVAPRSTVDMEGFGLTPSAGGAPGQNSNVKTTGPVDQLSSMNRSVTYSGKTGGPVAAGGDRYGRAPTSDATSLPSAYYSRDDIQYTPSGSPNLPKLSEALREYRTELNGRAARGRNLGMRVPAQSQPTNLPVADLTTTPSRALIAKSESRIAGRSTFGPGVNSDAGVAGAVVLGEKLPEDGEPAVVGVTGESAVDDNEQYRPIVENPFLSPNDAPLSTFSIDVDTGSYANVRRFLKHNQWPPANAVRVEELLNYFHYDYPEPVDGRPFAVHLEAGPCPWNGDHRLIRIGLKGKEIDKSQRPPSNLVFLLDVSGSMRDANKLPLVKASMEMLVGEMTEDDRIAIVTYSGDAGLALESTSGQDQAQIVQAIRGLNAGGSTNGEAGIKLAYEQAVGNFIDKGTNRVILCTDGDFNVGTSGDDELVTLIQQKAKSGVFLSVFGFGMGNLKDGKLEQIADQGNGHYGYIDDAREARKVFVEELAGTLYTIAKDVKLQVEFNPQQVGAYRLVGYENRLLAAPDFDNDAKDAGEIGAGHTVTALYEVIPPEKMPEAKPVDGLKYQKQAKPLEPAGDGKVSKELLTLKLRYKQPEAEKSVRFDFALTDDQPRTEMPSVDFEWAVSVAGFGLLLRNSQYRGQADFELIRELALGSKGDDASGRRREFLDLVYRAHAMHARQTGQPVPPRESLPEEKAREMARVQGKYNKLLKKLEVPADAATYGQFTEYGYWAGTSYSGQQNLPKGHWVYVAPHWYIWGEAAEKQPTP